MTNLALNRCDKVAVDTAGEEREQVGAEERRERERERERERGRVNVVVVAVGRGICITLVHVFFPVL